MLIQTYVTVHGESILATGTVELYRVLRTTPEKIYHAFTDAASLAKWLSPYGFTCIVEHLEAKVGGTFHMSFSNFTSDNGRSFGDEYKELVPGELVRYTDQFDDPNLPGEMQVTVKLTPVLVGTQIRIAQAGISEIVPVGMWHLGWQEPLLQLANLVESNVPG